MEISFYYTVSDTRPPFCSSNKSHDFPPRLPKAFPLIVLPSLVVGVASLSCEGHADSEVCQA